MTHIRLAPANEDLLTGALRAAWQTRVARHAAATKKAPKGRRGKR
jgi:hypothetical protein